MSDSGYAASFMDFARRIARSKASLIAIGGIAVLLTMVRVVAAADAQLLDARSLLFLLLLGAALAAIQRALTLRTERDRKKREGHSNLVEVQLLQVVLAVVFSFVIDSAIVFGYVLVAGVVLLNDALRLPSNPTPGGGSTR